MLNKKEVQLLLIDLLHALLAYKSQKILWNVHLQDFQGPEFVTKLESEEQYKHIAIIVSRNKIKTKVELKIRSNTSQTEFYLEE